MMRIFSNMLQGIDAEIVLLDDIVQQVYGDSRSQQQRAYRQDPSQFLAGLTTAIEAKILQCNGKVPVITGTFLLEVKEQS